MAKNPSDKRANTISLIVPVGTQEKKGRKADKGGEPQSMFSAVASICRSEPKPAKDMAAELNKITGQIEKLIAVVKTSPVGDMRLDGIEVGLAISAEGSIGIATAGVEASITLSFTKESS